MRLDGAIQPPPSRSPGPPKCQATDISPSTGAPTCCWGQSRSPPKPIWARAGPSLAGAPPARGGLANFVVTDARSSVGSRDSSSPHLHQSRGRSPCVQRSHRRRPRPSLARRDRRRPREGRGRDEGPRRRRWSRPPCRLCLAAHDCFLTADASNGAFYFADLLFFVKHLRNPLLLVIA
jgi:hypothetical protein